jgi:uncharacterized protein YraI
MVDCCFQVNAGKWCQESYETASGHARQRAKELRAAGYQVTVSSMGPQVTPLGLIKLTMVDVRPGANADTCNLPAVNRVDWPR